MPNIMLTYRCNLHCSYCFANEFVNKDKTDITLGNFMKALDFLTGEGETSIGLIGGEPTLHPGFPVFMELLTANPSVNVILLYTNGLLMDRFIPQITDRKVQILVNCNSPHIIGEKAYETMRQNLDTLIFRHGMKRQISLGINLYSDSMDYSYMLELLQRYDYHRVRIALTVPDFSTSGETDAISYFKERKAFLLRFFRDMEKIHVLPVYDCNKPPYCIWTEEEKEWLKAFTGAFPKSNTNLVGHQSKCIPVIDILPNLQAVRCFGMSDFLKLRISDFETISDLAARFVNEIDSNAYKLSACEDCRECYQRTTKHCVQGCIGFKAARIHACNDALERL